MLTMCVSS